MNELISDGGDCKTAPATPGLLKITKYMYNKGSFDKGGDTFNPANMFFFKLLVGSEHSEKKLEKILILKIYIFTENSSYCNY